jgi:glycerophosphoryl diester phosphodiesterase
MAHESVQVIASCGLHRDVPPNTIAAFEAAIRVGADMIETDFRRGAEGVIVIHDEMVAGRPVADLTRREIRDATGVLPPLLDDVIECCRGRIGINFELKEDGLEEDILDSLAPYFEPHQYLITSFHSSVVRRVKNLAPDAPTGLLTMRGLTQYFDAHPEWADYRSNEVILAEVKELGADYLLPDYADLDLLWAADEAGVETIAWGAETEATMRTLLPITRLRGLITERPSLLRHILEEEPDRPDGA